MLMQLWVYFMMFFIVSRALNLGYIYIIHRGIKDEAHRHCFGFL